MRRVNGFAAQERSGSWRWAIPALLLVAPFALWPIGALAWRAASPGGALSASVVADMARSRFYWGRLGYTTLEATASLALALVVGLPTAYVCSRLRFPLRSLLRLLATLPLLVPTLVIALAFRQVLAPGGWLNDVLAGLGLAPVHAAGAFWPILAAHTMYGVAVVAALVGNAWASVDVRAEEDAALLGADPRGVFRHTTLPALMPALRLASAIVFVFAFTSFAIVLVLGRPGLDTLEVVIFRAALAETRLPQAAVLVIVQVAATTLALLAFGAGGDSERGALPVGTGGHDVPPLREASWQQRALVLAVVAAIALLTLAPLAALVAGALRTGAAGGVTAAHFRHLVDHADAAGVAPLDALRWSATFAAGVGLLAMIAGTAGALAVARSRGAGGVLLRAVLRLPLAVPAVGLALAFLLTFHHGWNDLRGSPWLVLAAHTVIAYPIVLRVVLGAPRADTAHLADAARMLGASGWTVWRAVRLPPVRRAMLVGALLAAGLSLGEFGATSLLQRPAFATAPIAIYGALVQPGSDALGRALALSTILLAAAAALFLAVELARRRDARPR